MEYSDDEYRAISIQNVIKNKIGYVSWLTENGKIGASKKKNHQNVHEIVIKY